MSTEQGRRRFLSRRGLCPLYPPSPRLPTAPLIDLLNPQSFPIPSGSGRSPVGLHPSLSLLFFPSFVNSFFPDFIRSRSKTKTRKMECGILIRKIRGKVSTLLTPSLCNSLTTSSVSVTVSLLHLDETDGGSERFFHETPVILPDGWGNGTLLPTFEPFQTGP